MSAKDYVDQDARELTLNVLLGEYDLHRLMLLKSGELNSPSMQIQAHILGASDAVRIVLPEFKNLVFNEIFACTAVSGVKHVLRCGSLEDLLSAECKVNIRPRLKYSFCAELLSLNGNFARVRALEQTAEKYRDQPNCLGLVYLFPPNPKINGDPPKTIVALRCEGGSHVCWHSVHMYDSHNQLVVTESHLSY